MLKPDEEAVRALEAAGCGSMLARLLVNRGVRSAEEARAFLSGARELYDPWKLKGMAAAVPRILHAIEAKEKIVVYGDYDVDGVTATALLLTYLKKRGADAVSYIPERESEGYGLNAAAVQALCASGAKLIITVDTGISACEEVALANGLGTDVIITDHHEPRDTLPEAYAVVDPKQPGCAYPFKGLAGVGVALKLVCALNGDAQAVPEEFAEWAALGTVADVVTLKDENRTIVKSGLALMRRGCSRGIRCLLEASGAGNTRVTASLLSFTAAPRINAAGRMGSARDALELLTAEDDEKAAVLARKLVESNRLRQDTESLILSEALGKIGTEQMNDPVLMVRGDGWHCGVIGIVASRLAELYAKPAVVVSFGEGTGRASCRSFPGFDIHGALLRNAGLLERFGGHELAAGFTVKDENYAALYDALQACARALPHMPSPTLTLEFEPGAENLTTETARACEKLEPCGEGNPAPLFYIGGARVVSAEPLKEGRHLKLTLQYGGKTFRAVIFNAEKLGLQAEPGEFIDLAASLDINVYRGIENLSIIIRDLRPSRVFGEGRELYQQLLARPGATDARLLPARSDFAAVYRYLCACPSGRVKPEEIFARMSETAKGFSVVKLLLIFDVFSEMGLVSFSEKDNGLAFEINKNKKIDLRQSCLLRKFSGAAELTQRS